MLCTGVIELVVRELYLDWTEEDSNPRCTRLTWLLTACMSPDGCCCESKRNVKSKHGYAEDERIWASSPAVGGEGELESFSFMAICGTKLKQMNGYEMENTHNVDRYY